MFIWPIEFILPANTTPYIYIWDQLLKKCTQIINIAFCLWLSYTIIIKTIKYHIVILYLKNEVRSVFLGGKSSSCLYQVRKWLQKTSKRFQDEFLKESILKEKSSFFMSASIASITRANNKFHGLISGRSDQGKHWEEVRFQGFLYRQKKLIKIKIIPNIPIFQERNILIFIAHFACHLGVILNIFLGLFSHPLYYFFITCNSCNFLIKPISH